MLIYITGGLGNEQPGIVNGVAVAASILTKKLIFSGGFALVMIYMYNNHARVFICVCTLAAEILIP